MASLNEVSTPPEAPPEALKPSFGRKLHLVLGLVAIAIIAIGSIVVFTQFLLSVRGETVSLGLNYSVGEKMTYWINISVKTMGSEGSQEATWEMEVQGFDGENYTIHQTMTVGLQEFSFTVKMNKTGYIVEYIGLPPELEQALSSFASVPGFGSYFPKEEVRVGETWEIPFDMIVPGIDFEGTISYELSEITNVTVPAGTYEALKINIEGSDLHMEGMDFHVTWNISGYTYLEKASCHLIELRLDQSMTGTTTTAMGPATSMEMTMEMQLIEHLK